MRLKCLLLKSLLCSLSLLREGWGELGKESNRKTLGRFLTKTRGDSQCGHTRTQHFLAGHTRTCSEYPWTHGSRPWVTKEENLRETKEEKSPRVVESKMSLRGACLHATWQSQQNKIICRDPHVSPLDFLRMTIRVLGRDSYVRLSILLRMTIFKIGRSLEFFAMQKIGMTLLGFIFFLFLIFSNHSYAATYFLPDVQIYEVSDTLSIPPVVSVDSVQCEEIGYTYYSSGQCPAYHNQEVCVFSDRYLKCDAEEWCRDNGYTITSCSSPKYLDVKCSNNLSLYKKCTCPSEYKYSCTGTGYAGGSGTVCDGKYTSCTCANLYSWTGSACVHTHSYSCPSGYGTSNTGMISPVSAANTCACGATSGSCYKEGHTHSYSCPSGSYEASSSCSSGTSGTVSKSCSCGATSGSCYKCNSCASTYKYSCSGTGYSGGSGTACGGKYTACTCSSGYSWSGSSCSKNCTSSSSNYCYVHSSCHGNCCTDGTIQSCDPQCGGSGCSTDSSSSSSSSGTSVSLCDGVTCGTNASCSDWDGLCYCYYGYVGDPNTSCTNPCSGVRCGANARCFEGTCSCNSGYTGDPYTGCSVPRTSIVGDCSKYIENSEFCEAYVDGSFNYRLCHTSSYKCIWNDGYQQDVGDFSCLSFRKFKTLAECEEQKERIQKYGMQTYEWSCIEGSWSTVACGSLDD